jgi:hypothetical protein
VRCGQQLHVGTDLDIVADRHPRHVERHQTPIREATRPERGLVAVVAIEGWADLSTFTERPE